MPAGWSPTDRASSHARGGGLSHPGGSAIEPAKLLKRLARGDFANVRFDDLRRLIERLGFELRGVSGSRHIFAHHIFAHPQVPQLLNIQEVRGQANPYQMRQLLRLVEQYGLRLEDQA